MLDWSCEKTAREVKATETVRGFPSISVYDKKDARAVAEGIQVLSNSVREDTARCIHVPYKGDDGCTYIALNLPSKLFFTCFDNAVCPVQFPSHQFQETHGLE